MVNVKVKCHDYVRHVDDISHFPHVPRVGHIHVIAQEQCYNCLSIVCIMQYYNGGLMQLERRKVKSYEIVCLIFKLS